MEQGDDLERIARDPLAIFDWATEMVLNHVMIIPELAGRYQGQLEGLPHLRAGLESAPSRTDQYKWMIGFLDLVAQEYGSNMQMRVQMMKNSMAKYL